MSTLRRHIVEDLAFHLISARQFAKYVKAAFCTLNEILVDGIVCDDTTCCSDVQLKNHADEVLKNKELLRKQNLITALFDDAVV
jgi:hypothetical protein